MSDISKRVETKYAISAVVRIWIDKRAAILKCLVYNPKNIRQLILTIFTCPMLYVNQLLKSSVLILYC